jgi:hypothetical protein
LRKEFCFNGNMDIVVRVRACLARGRHVGGDDYREDECGGKAREAIESRHAILPSLATADRKDGATSRITA